MKETNNFRNSLTIAGIIALSSVVTPIVAQETVTSPVQQAISTQTYWTSDRKGAAQPMPLRTMSGSPSAALAGILQSSGQSGSVNGNAPGKKAIVADQQSIVAPAFGAGLVQLPTAIYTLRTNPRLRCRPALSEHGGRQVIL